MSDLVMRLVEANPPRRDVQTSALTRAMHRLSGWECSLCGSSVNVRRYPDLEPPAVFADCIDCRLTWELAPEGNVLRLIRELDELVVRVAA